MKAVSYRKWDINTDRIKKPTIRNSILQFLAQDFARPKAFSELWNFVRDKKICTKITLCVYLDGLEKDGLVKKVKTSEKRYAYTLSNWESWRELQKKYDRKMVSDVKKLQKDVNKAIKGIEKGLLTEKEISDFVLCMLTDFEARQLQGFDLLLSSKPIAPFVAPSLIEDFIVIPYNLSVQLLWVCFKKYPKASMEAIGLLKMNKKNILHIKGNKDILLKLGIKPKPLG